MLYTGPWMQRCESHQYDAPSPHLADATDGPVHVFDRDGLRALDRAAIEDIGIPGLVLMENAARAVAGEALDMLPGRSGSPGLVAITCGGGNNGGDGYAAARHLHIAGADVRLIPVRAPREGGDAWTNCRIAERMNLPTWTIEDLKDEPGVDLIIDAVLGTGATRPIEGDERIAIDHINAAGRPVLAVDLPSGLDADRGVVLGNAVRATRTVTLVGMKEGFLKLHTQPHVGLIVVAGIGIPPALVARFGRPLEPRPDDGRPGAR